MMAVTAVMAALTATACAGVVGPGQAPPRGDPPPPSRVTVSAPPTTLLSAQVVPPGPAERDYILPVRAVVHLLFSRPIDPLTLTPQQFVLALVDGRRIAPVGAFLSAGTGPGEQRSVALLIAASPSPAPTDKTTPVTAPAEPFSLTITGLLHDADGRVLADLAADIRPATDPVFPVRAEPGPAALCAGRGQALRVFWSAPVRVPTEGPMPILLRLDGSRGPAERVTEAVPDVPIEPLARPRLDLCAPGLAGVQAVELAAGAMVDERGGPTAASALTISPAP